MIGNGPIKREGRTFVFDGNALTVGLLSYWQTLRADPTMGGWKLSLN